MPHSAHFPNPLTGRPRRAQARALHVITITLKREVALTERLDSLPLEPFSTILVELEERFDILIDADEAYAAQTVGGLLCIVEGKVSAPGAQILRPGEADVYDLTAMRLSLGKPIKAHRFPATRLPPIAVSANDPEPEAPAREPDWQIDPAVLEAAFPATAEPAIVEAAEAAAAPEATQPRRRPLRLGRLLLLVLVLMVTERMVTGVWANPSSVLRNPNAIFSVWSPR